MNDDDELEEAQLEGFDDESQALLTPFRPLTCILLAVSWSLVLDRIHEQGRAMPKSALLHNSILSLSSPSICLLVFY